MKKLSYSQLLDLANEKKKTAKLFKSWGLWRYARDELRQASFFKTVARKKGKK